MNLSDVYSRQVKKIPVSNFSVGFGNKAPQIEKDPIINKLEQDVFAKMAELDKIDNPTPDPIPSNSTELKTFSLEDAIKELIMLKNK